MMIGLADEHRINKGNKKANKKTIEKEASSVIPPLSDFLIENTSLICLLYIHCITNREMFNSMIVFLVHIFVV